MNELSLELQKLIQEYSIDAVAMELDEIISKLFVCIDCSINTDEIHELYMIHDDLWKDAGVSPEGGMLCIQCLEVRLNRRLHAGDFMNLSINKKNTERSQMLDDRLHREPPWVVENGYAQTAELTRVRPVSIILYTLKSG
jgi:adenosine deaminase